VKDLTKSSLNCITIASINIRIVITIQILYHFSNRVVNKAAVKPTAPKIMLL
jgi:hypothetical protein